MISLQNDARNHHQLSQQLVGGMSRVSLNSDHRDEAPSAYVVKPEASLSLKPFKTEAHEGSFGFSFFFLFSFSFSLSCYE